MQYGNYSKWVNSITFNKEKGKDEVLLRLKQGIKSLQAG